MTTRRLLPSLLCPSLLASAVLALAAPSPAAAAVECGGYVDVAVDADGSSYLLAVTCSISGPVRVVKLDVDGNIVDSFGAGGALTLAGLESASAVVVEGSAVFVAGRGPRTSSADPGAVVAFGTDGELDTEFGTSGTATVGAAPLDVDLSDVVVDDTGRLVVTGAAGPEAGLVARLAADGSLDESFSSDGVDTGLTAPGAHVVITPSGYVVAHGDALTTTNDDLAVTRVLVGGGVDNSFGDAGSTTLELGDSATIVGIGSTTGSRIAVGVRTGTGPGVVVLDDDGQLDTSFRDDGIATFDMGATGEGNAFTVRDDGTMVVTALAYREITDEYAAVMVALTPSGALDNSFGRRGWLQAALPWNPNGVGSTLTGMAIDDAHDAVHLVGSTDGDMDGILPANHIVPSTTSEPLAWPDPISDTRFDGTNNNVLQLRADRGAPVDGLYVRSSGKLVVLTTLPNANGGTTVAVEKRRTSGRPDTSFGEGGTVVFPSRRALETPGAIAPQGTSILVAVSERGNERAVSTLMRISDDGVIDTAFGSGGRAVARTDASLTPVDIAIDGRGRIMVLSIGTSGSQRSAVLTRFKTNGQLYTNFGDQGTVSVDIGPDQSPLALTPHGAGYVFAVNSADPTVRPELVRITAGGVVDLRFDGDGFMVELPSEARDVEISDVAQVGGDRIIGGRLAVAYSRGDRSATGTAGRLSLVDRRGQPVTTFGDAGTRAIPNTRAHVAAPGGRRLVVTSVGATMTRVVYLLNGERDTTVPVVTAGSGPASVELIAVHPTDPSAPVYASTGMAIRRYR